MFRRCLPLPPPCPPRWAGDLPTLIATGALDPVTPPAFAAAILPGFTRGTLIELPHGGHGVTFTSACGRNLVTTFLARPDAPVDPSCALTSPSVRFAPPLYETSAPARAAAAMATHPRGTGLIAIAAAAALIWAFATPVRLALRRNRPHVLARVTLLLALVAAGGIGASVHLTHAQSPYLLLFGILSWGRWFLGLAAGAVLLALALTARHRGA